MTDRGGAHATHATHTREIFTRFSFPLFPVPFFLSCSASPGTAGRVIARLILAWDQLALSFLPSLRPVAHTPGMSWGCVCDGCVCKKGVVGVTERGGGPFLGSRFDRRRVPRVKRASGFAHHHGMCVVPPEQNRIPRSGLASPMSGVGIRWCCVLYCRLSVASFLPCSLHPASRVGR